jgi:hypothetical protein
MLAVQHDDRLQPVIDQRRPLVAQRAPNAAATVVAAHDDMLDMQDLDGEFGTARRFMSLV